MIEATFVGTGSAFSRKYGHTNILLECGDVVMMLDFGYLAGQRLEQLGRSLKDVTHVLVSHVHADHIGGLEELAFKSYFMFRQKPFVIIPETIGDELWESSLRGGLEWISTKQGDRLRCGFDDYFARVDLPIGRWRTFGGIQIKAFSTDHVPCKASCGFIIRDKASGEQLIFPGDTRRRIKQLERSRPLKDFASGTIFHDVQLFDVGPSTVHVFLEDLGSYPQAVRDRIVLVHYQDFVEERLEQIASLGYRIAWPGEKYTIGA